MTAYLIFTTAFFMYLSVVQGTNNLSQVVVKILFVIGLTSSLLFLLHDQGWLIQIPSQHAQEVQDG